MDWPAVTWAAPDFSWLILLGIPAAWLLHRADAQRQADLRRLVGEGRPARGQLLRRWLARLVSAAVVLLLVAALCRPQWGQVTQQEKHVGVDILIALDVSRSMLADDLSPNRLAVAKRAISELLPRLEGDRIGLIAFAGSAFMICPLTSDYDSFSRVLAEVAPETLPLGGTALSGALAEASRAFYGTSERGRFLIVISDGEDHAGNAVSSATGLRSAGVTVYGAAVGTAGGGLIPLPDGDFLRSPKGTIVNSRLQAEPLRLLATAGGGKVLDLVADGQALTKLYTAELSAAQRGEIGRIRYQLAERFQIPLTLALFLLLIESFLGMRGRT